MTLEMYKFRINNSKNDYTVYERDYSTLHRSNDINLVFEAICNRIKIAKSPVKLIIKLYKI